MDICLLYMYVLYMFMKRGKNGYMYVLYMFMRGKNGYFICFVILYVKMDILYGCIIYCILGFLCHIYTLGYWCI